MKHLHTVVVTPVIEAEGLTKTFGRRTALDRLDLVVDEGEVHGVLGPNGAGKSTTMRILLDTMRRSGGTVRVLGADPWNDATTIHRDLASVPGELALWPGLTGGEVVDVLADLRGGLDQDRPVALVSAFSSRARLLLLDEPSSGLDPLMEAVFQQCIREERAAGRTVLLSSHILPEVEARCDRVTIVRAGRTVESGTLAELRHLRRVSIEAVVSPPLAPFDAHPGVDGVEIDGDRLRLHADPAALPDVLARLDEAGASSLVSRPPSLEDLFLRHYDTATTTPGASVGAHRARRHRPRSRPGGLGGVRARDRCERPRVRRNRTRRRAAHPAGRDRARDRRVGARRRLSRAVRRRCAGRRLDALAHAARLEPPHRRVRR